MRRRLKLPALLLILALLLPLSACGGPERRRVKSPLDFQLARYKEEEARRVEEVQEAMLRQERSRSNRRSSAAERERLPEWPVSVPQYFIRNKTWSVWNWFRLRYPAVDAAENLDQALEIFCEARGIDASAFSLIYQTLDGRDGFRHRPEASYDPAGALNLPAAFIIYEYIDAGDLYLGQEVTEKTTAGSADSGPGAESTLGETDVADAADTADDPGLADQAEDPVAGGETGDPLESADPTASEEVSGETSAGSEEDEPAAYTFGDLLTDLIIRNDEHGLRLMDQYMAENIPPYTPGLKRMEERFDLQYLGAQNRVTAEEFAEVLEIFAEEGPRNDYLGLLAGHMLLVTYHDFFTGYLPQNVPVMHVYGERDGFRNDVGIVLTEDRPYAFVFFSENLPAPAETARELGLLIYCWNQRGSPYNVGIETPKIDISESY